MALLEIKDLYVSVDGKEILKGINLTMEKGETHVLMGPNGAGKSTLLNAIMDNPAFEVTSGEIWYEGQLINEMSTDERAKLGIFMSFQNPEAVPGITVANFLRASKTELDGQAPPLIRFRRDLEAKMKDLDMDPAYADRYLNVGFSGGEKKKDEILQLNVLNPTLGLLDETDSGLDVDAVRIVSKGIRKFRNENNALLIITHHKAILTKIELDRVHILVDGKIAQSGGKDLFDRVQAEGYAWLKETDSAESKEA